MTTFEQSRATYVAAQQQISVDAESVRSAQAALATARGNTGQTGLAAQDIESKRGILAQSLANVQLLKAEIAQTNITAPFDGVVTARLLDPGAYAGPNQPIVRVSEIGTVYVNVNVPDEDLPFVAVGTPVTFTTSSQPGHHYSGRVFDVNATPTTGTLSYRARVRQDNPDTSLRGGMLVAVNVRTAYHPNAVVVPRSAVFTSEAGANVFTTATAPAAAGAPAGPPMQKAVQVPVRLGLQTDTLAEIQSPSVRPGTTVIVTRPDALQNGSPVAVVGPRAPGAPGSHSAQ
jgi:RND family efflux transporter MFP subunit